MLAGAQETPWLSLTSWLHPRSVSAGTADIAPWWRKHPTWRKMGSQKSIWDGVLPECHQLSRKICGKAEAHFLLWSWKAGSSARRGKKSLLVWMCGVSPERHREEPWQTSVLLQDSCTSGAIESQDRFRAATTVLRIKLLPAVPALHTGIMSISCSSNPAPG